MRNNEGSIHCRRQEKLNDMTLSTSTVRPHSVSVETHESRILVRRTENVRNDFLKPEPHHQFSGSIGQSAQWRIILPP